MSEFDNFEQDEIGPYVAFGNDELAASPVLHIGDVIICPRCGESHLVEGGKNRETGEISNVLLFYNCQGTSYLAGVAGKNVMRRFQK